MPPTNSYLKAGVGGDLGSEVAYAFFMSDAGVVTATPIDLPILKDSDFKADTPLKDKNDEKGNPYAFPDVTKAGVELIHMQQDAAAKNFMLDLGSQKVCLVKEVMAVKVNGKQQIDIAPYCTPAPSFGDKKPGDEGKMSFSASPLPAQITIDLTQCTRFNIANTCASLVLATNTVVRRYEF